jgi:hypothetical protein
MEELLTSQQDRENKCEGLPGGKKPSPQDRISVDMSRKKIGKGLTPTEMSMKG